MTTDDSPFWYQGGLAFECTGCGNCCSGPTTGFVWVNDEEIRRLAQLLAMDDDLDRFERQFVRQVGARKSLVEYSDGDCIFLDEHSRKCSVYEARPLQCRTWPFWNKTVQSKDAWNHTAKDCPGCNRGPIYSVDQINIQRKDSP